MSLSSLPPSSSPTSHLKALDGLRGLAALVVLLSHSAYVLSESNGMSASVIKFSTMARRLGHPAVILFFTLSGFVLYLAFAKRGRTAYVDFMIRRVMRIYPALLAALAVAVALKLLLDPVARSGLGPWTTLQLVYPWDLPMVLRNALLVGVTQSDTRIDPVTWSLAVEMRFSVLFPALAILCRYSRTAVVILSLLGYTAGIIVLKQLNMNEPYLFAAALPGSLAITLFYLPSFGFGLAAADYYLSRSDRGQIVGPITGSLAALAMLILAKLIGGDLALAFAFTGLVFLACQPGPIGTFARLPPCLFLGRISYSLYLVHFPILIALVYILNGKVSVFVPVLVAPILSIVAAMLMYRFIESMGIRVGSSLAARYNQKKLVPATD